MENLAWHISRHKISHLLCIPSLYLALLSEAPPEFGRSLRAIIVAGESCPSELVNRHEQALLESTLYNEYGPTEASVWCTVYQHSAGQLQRCVPIGKPIANTQVYVLDQGMEPVAIGVTGEMYVGGPGVVRGYLNRGKLTAEKFVPNPFNGKKGDRLYRTGDRVRWLSDGNIEYGRVDDQ